MLELHGAQFSEAKATSLMWTDRKAGGPGLSSLPFSPHSHTTRTSAVCVTSEPEVLIATHNQGTGTTSLLEKTPLSFPGAPNTLQGGNK